jgi:ABC-type lipoprotein export system ATPase subunit
LLRDLVKDHRQTIVMVTHDSQVAKAASRLVRLRDGMIESDQPQAEWTSAGESV